MQTKRNKIMKRMFYRIPVELVSPMSVSSGTNAATDHDVLVTEHGLPFITGSSIAGAFREYLHGNSPDLEKSLFGFIVPPATKNQNQEETQKGAMSRLFVSDIVFENAVISVRDGVALTEDKTADDTGKFNYQIAEAGASGILCMEIVIYENDDLKQEQIENAVQLLLSAMQAGVIRFGFKKNRGMGRMQVTKDFGYRFFDFLKGIEEARDYLKFLENESYEEKTFVPCEELPNDDCITMKIPLTLTGGISIRTYSAKPNDPDYSHLTSRSVKGGTVPVIPGSSWNGAIRARAIDLLKHELDCKKLVAELEAAWGKQEGNTYTASQILFAESEMEKAHMLRMTRNKINRFDASTVNSALYTERTCVEGNTELEIRIRKPEDNAWIAGLLWLAVQDLCHGLLAVGGLTSVGRGIFSGEYALPDEEYLKALQQKIEEVKAHEANQNA